MIKIVFLLLHVSFVLILSGASSIDLKPHASESFNVSYIQNLGSCSYTVIITTSCSSTRYTRDQISLAFGDAYGNQIYAPRLDDPSTRTFERCSSDTFQIYGPCAYQICYAYLYRSGPDGWKPKSVRIYGYNSRAVTFTFDTFIPGNIWFGVNLCGNTSNSHKQTGWRWFLCAIIGLVPGAIM